MPRQEEGRTPAGGRAERITWGVLFVTYSALVGSNRSGQSRLEQAGVASSQPVQSVTTTLLPTEAMLSTIATLLLATLPVRMVVAHGGHTAVRERGAASCRWPRGWAAPRRRAASSATRATRPSTSPRPRRRAAPRRAARAAGAAAGGARRWGRSNRRLTLTLTQTPNPNQVGGSKTAECVSALQERCPRARVVYCSATGASAIEQMCYMRRLGLYYCISNSCHSPPTSHPSPLTTHHSPLPHH